MERDKWYGLELKPGIPVLKKQMEEFDKFEIKDESIKAMLDDVGKF